MRVSTVLFFTLFLMAGSTLSQKAPPGLTEKLYEVWDCNLGRTHPAKKTNSLKVAQISKIAIAAAKKKGVDITKYELSTVCFVSNESKHSWTVFFEGIVPAPGNHFSITVDDRDKAVAFIPGE